MGPRSTGQLTSDEAAMVPQMLTHKIALPVEGCVVKIMLRSESALCFV
jgi:hypothetical protein